jgi:predicted nucleic acid-binding protein
LPRAVVSFEEADWTPPEALLLDTSIVVEALLPSQPAHTACVTFFERVAASDCTLVFSRLLEMELCEVLFNVALKERYGKRWASARYDGRARRRAGRLLEAGRRAWAELLDSFSWSYVELDEVTDAAPKLMRAYGFRSYDAVHAASLEVVGLRDMVTLDHGFAAMPQSRLTIHTTRARASTMRRRRARR